MDLTASQNNTLNIVFKIIIIGDAGVGKSCLLMRFSKDQSINDYNPTIGIEFQSKVICIDDNTSLKLQIWDTAGQESFRSIVRSFYRNSASIFLVYSIVDRESFQNIESWYEEARNNSQDNVVFVLVGTQLDRDSERKVKYEEGAQLMKLKNIALFFETSSFTGTNVDFAFIETAKLIYKNHIREKQIQPEVVTYNQSKLVRTASDQSYNMSNQIDDVDYYKGKKLMELQLMQDDKKQKKKCC